MKPLPALKQGIVSADRRVRVRPRGLQQTDSFKRQPRETGWWPNHRTQRERTHAGIGAPAAAAVGATSAFGGGEPRRSCLRTRCQRRLGTSEAPPSPWRGKIRDMLEMRSGTRKPRSTRDGPIRRRRAPLVSRCAGNRAAQSCLRGPDCRDFPPRDDAHHAQQPACDRVKLCPPGHNVNMPNCFNRTHLHAHGRWLSPAGNSDNVADQHQSGHAIRPAGLHLLCAHAIPALHRRLRAALPYTRS